MEGPGQMTQGVAPLDAPGSPLPHEQARQPTGKSSLWAAVWGGIRPGAGYGAIIAGGLALLIGSAVLVVAYTCTAHEGNLSTAILSVLLGAACYAARGAVVGAVVLGTIAACRFRGRTRGQTFVRVAFGLLVVAAVGAALGSVAYWCSLPGMTSEHHVFFFLNLCHDNKYEEAARYLDRHPEIATDRHAINDEPTLNAAAFFDGNPRTTELLLDYGADVNAADEFGTTALEVAITSGHLRVARTLLERGAKPVPRCKVQDARDLQVLIERQLTKRAPDDHRKEYP